MLWLVGAARWPVVVQGEVSSANLAAVLVFGIMASILLALFVFDARWYVLPDELTLTGIVVALLLNGLVLGLAWQQMVLAGALGAAWFGGQYLVSKGRWVGSGDIRFGALMGVMLGSWQGLLLAFVLAYVIGGVIGMYLIVRGKSGLKSQFPFGTALAAATVLVLLSGAGLWQWYLGLLW